MTQIEVQRLAMYNAERARGIVHTPEWDAQMTELQQRFNEEFLGRAGREDDCACGHDHGVSTNALHEALSRVPSCTWHGHGAYPDSCWWCALNRVIPPGREDELP